MSLFDSTTWKNGCKYFHVVLSSACEVTGQKSVYYYRQITLTSLVQPSTALRALHCLAMLLTSTTDLTAQTLQEKRRQVWPPRAQRLHIHSVIRRLLLMYKNTTSHAHYRCTMWKSSWPNWLLGGLFLENICKTCFRVCNSRSYKFIIRRQNAPKYVISRHQIQLFFVGRGQCSLPTSLPVERGNHSPHPTHSVSTAPRSLCPWHLPPR